MLYATKFKVHNGSVEKHLEVFGIAVLKVPSRRLVKMS